MQLHAITATVAGYKGINTVAGETAIIQLTSGEKVIMMTTKEGTTFTYPDGIRFQLDLPKHVAMFDGFSQKKGISGAHNADDFYAAAKEYNVKIVSETPTGVKGITHVKYLIATKDRAGNLTGSYKATPEIKTIYDPKVFSDQKILEIGNLAAANAYKEAMSSANGAANATIEGISFRIYVDKPTGIVKSFHPN
ncbi:hypothetical protein G5647_19745 [Pectobacterium carotovorum]|nr:hypothetical protein [Pectobacterium carotovorum]MBQ4776793.1 hypothetical protein [Pectobacterium versatile]